MSTEQPVGKRKDGGNAFPLAENDSYFGRDGMSLRDYFAAKAMTALIIEAKISGGAVPTVAYIIADEMLKAREEGKGGT